jgi:O-acetyl-ADP-ribose deacetylase (regulator of RNase III)
MRMFKHTCRMQAVLAFMTLLVLSFSLNADREQDYREPSTREEFHSPEVHNVSWKDMSMSHKSDPLRPGSHFRGMLIHSQLGEGGMGTAFLASHPVLRRPVVIKVFKDVAGDDLFKEAHLAARVSSSFATGVIDAGIKDGLPYIIQNYVDGLDLCELLCLTHAAGMRLPVGMVNRMIMHAAQGLHSIHQAGVVHRDVKPANLFLRGNGTTTVGDFGIAIPAKARGGPAGTPYFMAPEQWLKAPMDRRVDIYALGVTAHLLLTGTLPFDADVPDKHGQAHVKKSYTPPKVHDPRAAYLFAVIERMLRKDPSDRYPTAAAVASDLSEIYQDGPVFVQIEREMFRVGDLLVGIRMGDLAQIEADVLVNAAHWSMDMTLGVAAALRKAGGAVLEKAAKKHAPAAMGAVVWTEAGKLRTRYVAHAVAALSGAVCLQRCTLRALLGTEERQASSIAFPSLGTGVGEVPQALASQLMLEAIRTFAELKPSRVGQIDIVLNTQKSHETWLDIICSM